MLIIGITGGIGTGKTTVAKMFARRGAIVLDADLTAHRLIEPRRIAWRKIIVSFGKDILNRNGTVNRKLLADKVFADRRSLKKLCDIIHPLVYKEIKKVIGSIKRRGPAAVIVLDVPLLLESGKKSMVDVLIVVKCSRSKQVKRARKKLGLTHSQFLQRLKSQMQLRDKIRAADFVIDNSGSIGSTEKQAMDIWERLEKS